MAFALSPDKNDPNYNGFPRLIRFVDRLVGHTVARLDRATNVLTIDRRKFDSLNDFEKQEVIKTHSAEVIFASVKLPLF